MPQPVKLSTPLVLDARMASEPSERSIAGQVEFWARLGRAIEPLLRGTEAIALARSGAAKSLLSCLNAVETPQGRERLQQILGSLPFPHYAPAPDRPGFLIRTDADGAQTLGRFVNRAFVAAPKSRRQRVAKRPAGSASRAVAKPRARAK